MAWTWEHWKQIVRDHNRFVITSHVRPDGDSIGSAMALKRGLEKLGKHVTVVSPGHVPVRYQFVDPQRQILTIGEPEATARLGDCEVIVILDTSCWDQLGPIQDIIRSTRALKVIIDHHVSENDLGGVVFKDITAAACGILVFDALKALNCPLDPLMAEALFVAVATDTGWFRYSSTDPRVFRMAAELVEQGARPHWVHRRIYEESSLGRLHLMGRALERLQLSPSGRVSWTVVRQADLEETGAEPQDTEDLVNYTMAVADAEVGLLFVEVAPETTKVSFRSKDEVDCTRLAARFGGGGHRRAAGALVSEPIDQALQRVIEVVERELAQSRTTSGRPHT
jgi:phosphoesterase RecJ-like protein